MTFILNETLTFLFYLSRGATGQEKRIAKISGLNDEYHKLMNWQPLTKLSQFPEIVHNVMDIHFIKINAIRLNFVGVKSSTGNADN